MTGRLDSQPASERKEAGVSVKAAGDTKRRKRNIRLPVSLGMALAVCLLIVILLIHSVQNLIFKDRDKDPAESRKGRRLAQ